MNVKKMISLSKKIISMSKEIISMSKFFAGGGEMIEWKTALTNAFGFILCDFYNML
jgi:hypothetical protein